MCILTNISDSAAYGLLVFCPLFALATLRQITPSGGLNLIVTKNKFRNVSATNSPTLCLHCCLKYQIFALLCVCRRKEQCSVEPRPSSLMCRRIRMPSTRFVHTYKIIHTVALQQRCYGMSDFELPSVFLFSSGGSMAALPCPSHWLCVVCSVIFLSLVLFKSMWISPAHSAILGLLNTLTCVCRRSEKRDIKLQLSLDHDQAHN